MKNIGLLLILFSLFSCETKYNYIDTGLANGRFDGTMYDYLHSSSYDWDSTLLLVERAGLRDLFQGKQTGYEKMTFFGPTNLSILRWMIEQEYDAIQDIPVEVCRDMLLKHVVAGVHKRDDSPRGEQILGQTQGEGGEVFTNAFGTKFWIYSFRNTYHDIPDVGPVYLKIISFDSRAMIDVASTDIETDNGFVHSLDYSYTLGQL